MSYDVFISYAREDASSSSFEIEKILLEHDVSPFRDISTGCAPGGNLLHDITAAIKGSRKLIAVLTERYIDSRWTEQEYKIAKSAGVEILPVVYEAVGEVSWLKRQERSPTWYDSHLRYICFGSTDRERSIAQWELLEAAGPARCLIDEAQAAAATSTTEGLNLLEQHLIVHQLRGLQCGYVMAYKSLLLRLVGRREDARKEISKLNFSPNDPYPIVHTALIASALLSIDDGEFAAVRARLSEAAAMLSRKSSWNSDDKERRRLLAEVMRETARTYLQEAQTLEDDDRALSWLEVAWSVYIGVLAVVTETEDLLSHAWIHENLGILMAAYARRSPSPGHAKLRPMLEVDYPALVPLRGRTAKLLDLSEKYLTYALRLFSRVTDVAKSREGEAWATYHRAQTQILSAGEDRGSLDKIMSELSSTIELFDGIPEGQGMVYRELHHLAHRRGDGVAAAQYGRQAVQLLHESEKYSDEVAELEHQLDLP